MKNETELKLKDTIRELMKTHRYSLHQMSKLLNINKSTVHNYANGVVPQGFHALIKISRHFNISIEELLFGLHQNKTLPPEPSNLKVLLEQLLKNKDTEYEIIIKRITKNK